MSNPDTRVLKGRIEIRAGDRHVTFNVRLPRGQVPLSSLIPLARQMSSTIITWASEDAKTSNRPCSCGPRCAACCRYAVFVGHAEARHLAELVDSLPEPRRTTIRQRFSDALHAIRRAGLLARWAELAAIERQEPRLAAAGFDQWAVEYFKLNIPCPFLQNECCSIYAVRPLICREYLVTNAPSQCASVGSGGWAHINRIPLHASVAGAVCAVGLEGEEEYSLPLVCALEWTASHPRAGSRRTSLEWAGSLQARLQHKPEDTRVPDAARASSDGCADE